MKKKLLIIGGIICLIIIFIGIITRKDTVDEVGAYLEENNFVKEENSTMYIKQVSENNLDKYEENKNNNINSSYEELDFNVDTYKLTKIKKEYEDMVETTFTPSYDYKNQNLTYKYRLTYNTTNVIIEGIYSYDINNDQEEFTCEVTYAHDIDITNSKDSFCEKVQYDVKDFYYEAFNLITKASLLNKIEY